MMEAPMELRIALKKLVLNWARLKYFDVQPRAVSEERTVLVLSMESRKGSITS